MAPTATTSDHGEVILTYAKTGERWAAIEPLSSQEYTSSDRTTGQITHKIVLRHDAEITPRYRLQHGDRTFEIAQPVLNEAEYDDMATFMAYEVT